MPLKIMSVYFLNQFMILKELYIDQRMFINGKVLGSKNIYWNTRNILIEVSRSFF
jgi:hypothetical protein